MPNKYEREIEEILRNLEQTEPKPTIGQKLSGRLRRKTEYRSHTRRPAFPSINLTLPEWFLVIAVVAALFAGGYAYAQGTPSDITGFVALIGTVCLLVVVLSPFLRTNRSTRSTRYGNVTPLPRGPFSTLKSRWHLLMLKLRYRRNQR